MSKQAPPKRTTRFKELLNSPELDFLCEAHNGITARIAEEAGFNAIWAGGLCMSAQYGVRDSNEASWTQVLEMLEFMADASSVPILLDGDTGYGNFNNVRRLVAKLEQRNIAAVCIEDKLFPKTNSFIDGNKQELADIDEFCSRIKAGKDAQQDDDFSIITRVEAFIAGWGLSEAMKRAEAYHEAGSDGILIHSALSNPSEVLAFKKEWADRSPVVIVPTKYYATPTDIFREAGFSLAIWANHLLRAGIVAMRECAETMYREQSLLSMEDRIVPVKEIFRLQGASELQDAEERYLPQRGDADRVVVLAASRGTALGALTEDRPKTMVEVQGQSLLGQIISTYNASGIKNIMVVRGYKSEAINLQSINYADNNDYADTGELLSLQCALAADVDDEHNLYISFGDVLFKRYIIESLAEHDEDFVIAVDTNWQDSVNRGRAADYVSCSEPYTRHAFNSRVLLTGAGEELDETNVHGEWTGIMRVSAAAMPRLRELVASMASDPANKKAKLHHLLAALTENNENVRVVYTTGHWLDVDSIDDVVAAGNFT
ncbi:MAG: phosphoenolpyruvate mutase [Gammaproteobacteria bacterium]|nr:phosphoenolpyruvate mutase [Gammaproteobacteria bacterium]MCP4091029.1 phosphoenolpyruvate mutase [Gammaproteobacteria bacterium]MCP4277445.1 phosphoenolpyruvate mutase [Gammaproteobacteria bacterium]MCP4831494.1 phosphoenolpyruvate mutase [Gammaproteobacteria bacterium]MCP4927717.1 phosphoenolpyruvate mutase [Gammaproteobacteria bacterium]